MNCPHCNKKLCNFTLFNEEDDTLQCTTNTHFFVFFSEQSFYLTIKKIPYYYTIKKNDHNATITVSHIVFDINNIKLPIVTHIDPNFTYHQCNVILNKYINLQSFL